ncbi:DUF6879 family protein [Streptomyces mayteni]
MKSKVPGFDELLGSARHSALHLEMRDTYAVAEEREDVARWEAGRWTHEHARGVLAGWFDLVSRTVGRGVAVRRVRIVSEPVSDYVKFEHFTTPLNIEAPGLDDPVQVGDALGEEAPAFFDDHTVRDKHPNLGGSQGRTSFGRTVPGP